MKNTTPTQEQSPTKFATHENTSFSKSEAVYLNQLVQSELNFGKMSGETGLALMALEDFYRKNGALNSALEIEVRIKLIIEEYLRSC